MNQFRLNVDLCDLAPTFRLWRHDIVHEADTAVALAAIASGREPLPETLARAPVLQAWRQTTNWFRQTVLAGIVSGHPTLADGPIRTSALRAIAIDLTWARTSTRFYQLGEADILDAGAR